MRITLGMDEKHETLEQNAPRNRLEKAEGLTP
jgi:hypothetical protein